MAGRTRIDADSGYDAFVSYNHEADLAIATVLQRGLQRFARPWYRRRSMRVFRDQTNMRPNSDLWSTVQSAIDRSEFLILVASPQSAESPWVAREVAHWLNLGRRDRLLIAVTGGKVAWEGSDFDWSLSTALTPALAGAFNGEPLFVDLGWARDVGAESIRDPRMQAAMATLAAAIKGCPVDELIGDDLREHRRTKLLIRSVIIGLSLLLAISVTASIVAVRQRAVADEQRNIADERARVALGRQLSAQADVASSGDIDSALLMAAHGYAVEPDTPGAASALLSTVSRSPDLIGFLPDSVDPTSVAVAPTDDMVAIGDKHGEVTLWQAKDRRRLSTLVAALDGRPVSSVAFSGDGRIVIAGTDTGAYGIWQIAGAGPEAAEPVQLASGRVAGRVTAVGLDSDGRGFAIGTAEGRVIWGSVDGSGTFERNSGSVGAVAVLDDQVVAGDGQGHLQRWWSRDGAPVSDEHVGFGMPVAAAFSADMQWFAGATVGQQPYVTAVGSKSMSPFDIGQVGLSIDDMAFDPTGRSLAISTRAGVILWDVEKMRQVGPALIGLPGAFVDLAVEAGGRVVIGVGDRGVAVWDLDAQSPLLRQIRPPGAPVTSDVPRVVRGATSVTFSADAHRIAWTAFDEQQNIGVVVWDLELDRELAKAPGERAVSFSPDGTELATSSFHASGYVVTDLAAGTSVASATLPWSDGDESKESGPEDRGRAARWELANSAAVGAGISADRTLELWDVNRSQAIGQFTVDAEPDAAALAFDPSGARLAVAATGGTLTLVDTDPRSWWHLACSMAGRTMSDRERHDLTGDVALPSMCPAG